jgi:hypothetical protein
LTPDSRNGILPRAAVNVGKSTAVSPTPRSPGPVPTHRAAGATDLTSSQERYGQRVLLRIRAQIHVMLQGKATTLDVATLSVNPRGALVVANQSLPAETLLVLEHSGTRQRVACKVTRPPQKMSDGYHVPVEFDTPTPDFWKIDFPPTDWRPEE